MAPDVVVVDDRGVLASVTRGVLRAARDFPRIMHLHALGSEALEDQRLAATIMWAGGLPAFAIPALARAGIRNSRHGQHVRPDRG